MSQVEAGSVYDALAPFYRDYAERKSAYLAAVNKYIVDHAPKTARSLLDVGAGDGVRGMAIAESLGIQRIVLCEPGDEMAARCRALAPAEVWQLPAERLPAAGEKFDLILCLWNVLGHLPDRAARIRALRGMAGLLAEGGRIFLDVNNRHNASAYGWLKVFGREILDAIAPDDRRGDSIFEWKIDGKSFPGRGHLFTPAEIIDIIDGAGLTVENRVAVHYLTGATSKSPLRGQLLYQLRKRTP